MTSSQVGAGGLELTHTHIRTQRATDLHALVPKGKTDLDELLTSQLDAGWELLHYSTSSAKSELGGIEIYHDMIWRRPARPPL